MYNSYWLTNKKKKKKEENHDPFCGLRLVDCMIYMCTHSPPSFTFLFPLQRHPHGGGGGGGARSVPPRQGERGGHGTRGPSHGYGEGRGAQYYPKGTG